ncbi:MAG: sigma-70 family RNA polymerase sigma factor [Desulfobacteraceae bacterium]|nr:sigma-70 family RNA polymerase sigma factor [Desulfobacteraceae bacterium]
MNDLKHTDDYEFTQQCLKNKDIDAFYKRYKTNIQKTIMKHLYGEMATHHKDIFQEVTIYLFYKEGLTKYAGTAKLSTWLFRVVMGRTIDYIRSLIRKKENFCDPQKMDKFDRRDQKTTCKTIEEETRMLVRQSLKELRETWNHKKIVLMEKHHMESLTYNQLERIFSTPQTTVYRYIQEAEEKFRNHYSNLYPDYEEAQK